MELAEFRERGTISEETEIINEGDYIAYAEARYGPYAIMFYRGSKRSHYMPSREGRYKISGPFIVDKKPDGSVMYPPSEEVTERVMHAVDSWDYIELGETEVFDNG